MIQVVVDSTADIPRRLREELGIRVVPLSVRFGEDVYQDGVDLTGDQFYHRLAHASTLPATAAPSPGAFAAVYQEALAKGRRVLSLHISSKLSGTYAAAALAAREFGAENVAVVDSKTASMALGWLAVKAAEEARAGASLARLLELVRGLVPHAHVYLALDTLENLRKGGRIGRASALLGTLLNVKPVVTVIEGEVSPVERVRTMGKTLTRLVELAKAHEPVDRIAVGYTDVLETGERLREMMAAALPDRDVLLFQAGPTIGTYTGRGAVGAVFLGKAER
jgi:DegV family protein with EDD domain